VRDSNQNPHADPGRIVGVYARSLAAKRWQKYRLRVASGELTAENYVYRRDLFKIGAEAESKLGLAARKRSALLDALARGGSI
jgi:hypothetical protein